MNSNGTMFGMCNPEAAGVYGHHPHHQSQHYTNSSPADLGGSPSAYCGSVTTTSESSSVTGNGGHHYGLHAAAAQAAAVAAAASSVSVSESGSSNATNNNRSNSVEAAGSGGQHSPTGIISDNGLQYANLDGSVGPPGGGGGGGYPSYGHHPAMTAGYHYSDIHGDGSLAAAAAAAASGASQAGNISAYFDNSTAAAAAYAQSQYPSIYGQHHPHSLKSIRGSAHDFSPSSYPADFAAAAAVSKPAPAVPTYKWMQVKRNVPKPGRSSSRNTFFKTMDVNKNTDRYIWKRSKVFC